MLRYIEPKVKPTAFMLESRTAKIHKWNSTVKERGISAQKKRE